MPDYKYQTLLADVETDGLLDQLTRIHTLNIREFETGLVWRFRRNKHENTIQDGLDMLCDAASIVFHNGIGFDMLAIAKVYPDFDPPGVLEDTFIYSQLLFSNIKESDFVRWHKGKLAGKLLGSHSLEAWGQRFDLAKGDYKVEMEAKAKELGITDKDEITKFVWGTWNQEMDDYCDQDVVVLTKLWAHCLAQRFPQDSIDFEHATAEFAVNVGLDGIPFDIPAAEKLAAEMKDTMGELVTEAKEFYGTWFAPGKQVITRMLWDDPDGKNKSKTYAKPQEEYGENMSRAIWAAVDVSKRNTIFKSLYKTLKNKKTGVEKTTLNYDKFENAFFTKTQLKEFKPTSRNNIVDRYTVLYDWQPVDFTDGGAPSVNDDVLRNLIGKFPMAEELAEIFYYSKRIGMIATGPNAWLKQVKSDGKIHHRLNMLGTGTGRASHSYPNMSQVMAVMIANVLGKDGKINDLFILPDGSIEPGVYNPDGTYKKKAIVKGRKGNHGFECRSMFYVYKGWKQVGTDLSGIQLRCLAAVSAPFDNGFLIDVILNGDIHELNQKNTDLDTRDKAKTLIYGTIFGAGDVKAGAIVDPLATENEQRIMGKVLKMKLMQGLPGLDAATKKVKREAKRGFITGLDGRRIFIRSPHSALNFKLQGDEAVIAKRWCLMVVDKFLDAGYKMGWDHDFVIMLFSHDEIQVAVKEGMEEWASNMMIEAAQEAGEFYDFAMKVDAESKIGMNWAECH